MNQSLQRVNFSCFSQKTKDLPVQRCSPVLAGLVLILGGRDEGGLQPKDLLELCVEARAIVDMELKAIDGNIQPGLRLGV